MTRRDRPAEIRPEALYRWPDEIQARLGLGRSVYDLVRVGGMPVLAFGRRRFVRGASVIAALEACAETVPPGQDVAILPP